MSRSFPGTLIAATLCFVPTQTWAANDAVLSGIVLDRFGAPLVGATFAIRDVAGEIHTTSTDGRGRFSLLTSGVPPKSVSLDGYAPYAITCPIPFGATARIVVRLDPDVLPGANAGSDADISVSARVSPSYPDCTIWPETQDRYVL